MRIQEEAPGGGSRKGIREEDPGGGSRKGIREEDPGGGREERDRRDPIFDFFLLIGQLARVGVPGECFSLLGERFSLLEELAFFPIRRAGRFPY